MLQYDDGSLSEIMQGKMDEYIKGCSEGKNIVNIFTGSHETLSELKRIMEQEKENRTQMLLKFEELHPSAKHILKPTKEEVLTFAPPRIIQRIDFEDK